MAPFVNVLSGKWYRRSTPLISHLKFSMDNDGRTYAEIRALGRLANESDSDIRELTPSERHQLHLVHERTQALGRLHLCPQV